MYTYIYIYAYVYLYTYVYLCTYVHTHMRNRHVVIYRYPQIAVSQLSLCRAGTSLCGHPSQLISGIYHTKIATPYSHIFKWDCVISNGNTIFTIE